MKGPSSALHATPASDFRAAPPGFLQRKCACGQHTGGSECAECRKKRDRLQRSGTAGATTMGVPPSVPRVLRRAGHPLHAGLRANMEAGFGHSFSDVRVHTDRGAADSAQAVNARAYTVGSNIVFGAGQYQPGTRRGRELVAHELTHVLQQPRTTPNLSNLAIVDDAHERALEREADQTASHVAAAGTAGMPTLAPTYGATPLRRQADIDLAPPGLPCILATGLAPSTGTNLLFERGGATVSANHLANLGTFVRAWVANGSNEDVIVEGYASTDGPQSTNWRLSCDRAEQTKLALIGLGIPEARIETWAAGETDTFSATDQTLNRRAIVSSVPAAAPAAPGPAPAGPAAPGAAGPAAPAPAAAPRLTPVVSVGPAPTTCGGMNFVINWTLSGNAAANGGFIIQEVTFNWSVVDCNGVDVANPDPRTSPLTYFEAWRALPNSTNLTPITTDTFFWPSAAPWGGRCSTGNVTIIAVARYHDNVAALPAHMIVNNPATFAGGLQSSLTDPALGGNTSPLVPHSLTFHWDCCPCSTQPTILDGHEP